MFRRTMILVLFALIAPAASWACACSEAPPGTCPHFDVGDTVFLGTVTQITEVPTSGNQKANQDATATPILRYHFRIDEQFGRVDNDAIDIYSGGDDGDCAFRFNNGEQYVVFAQRESQDRLFATQCNGTRPASQATALLPQLRAIRDGAHVASVFGVLRRADPPTLALPDDPDEPLVDVPITLRSHYDRFTTTTGANGVYSIYDVHAGEYEITAALPSGTVLTHRGTVSGLASFKIPAGACYEFNVDALPTGQIEGTVFGPDGKPLPLASLELYRAGSYKPDRSGLWTFQGSTGSFLFDHIGPGKYIIVYNRANRIDPNAPFPRTFYPGTPNVSDAQPIDITTDGQVAKVKFKLGDEYPTRVLRVHLEWKDGKPPGSVFVMAKADRGDNPAANPMAGGIYAFTLLGSAHYTVSAWEELDHAAARMIAHGRANCSIPARINSNSLLVNGSDASTSDVTLTFSGPDCQ
ncbi:MAG: hypothetical protein ACRD8A_07375 [Candidatus Acidiferrales bacterium]